MESRQEHKRKTEKHNFRRRRAAQAARKKESLPRLGEQGGHPWAKTLTQKGKPPPGGGSVWCVAACWWLGPR